MCIYAANYPIMQNRELNSRNIIAKVVSDIYDRSMDPSIAFRESDNYENTERLLCKEHNAVKWGNNDRGVLNVRKWS